MATYRKQHRAASNNPINPNQNICAQAVARALGVADNVRHLHTIMDVKRAAGTRFSVRSVKTAAKSKTVGGARKNVASIEDALAFIVYVKGHVILLKNDGSTIVDTAPRKRDRRQILSIHGVYAK